MSSVGSRRVISVPRQQRTGRPYRRLRDQVISEEDLCSICGLAVDKSLSGRHRWGPSMDHEVSLRRGGPLMERANCHLAHSACNAAKRDGRRVRVRHPHLAPLLVGISEAW